MVPADGSLYCLPQNSLRHPPRWICTAASWAPHDSGEQACIGFRTLNACCNDIIGNQSIKSGLNSNMTAFPCTTAPCNPTYPPRGPSLIGGRLRLPAPGLRTHTGAGTSTSKNMGVQEFKPPFTYCFRKPPGASASLLTL